MNTSVIMSLISLLGTIIGTVGGILISAKLLTYRVEQLEKKVDKHNSVIERTYSVEARLDVIDEQIKVANHRLTDLESKTA